MDDYTPTDRPARRRLSLALAEEETSKGVQLPEVGHACAAFVATEGATEGSDREPPGSGPVAEHLEVRAGPPCATFSDDTGALLDERRIQARACCCHEKRDSSKRYLLESERNVTQGENRKEVNGNLCHFSSLDGAEDPFPGKTSDGNNHSELGEGQPLVFAHNAAGPALTFAPDGRVLNRAEAEQENLEVNLHYDRAPIDRVET